ncbi:2Fe-2S iron-sulfur cluster-binding protein [Streptomyces sp. NPDC015127]|uniref:2Fe-2S iron-sulfur cluster-binding protein n=1 Tax=Streptomyces sp. NPDC015127 TaxID=3364939 RepID=UPI0036FB0AE8
MSNEDHQQGRFPDPSDHEEYQDGGEGRLDLPDAFVQDGPHDYPQSAARGYAADAQDYQGYQGEGQGYQDHGQGYHDQGQGYQDPNQAQVQDHGQGFPHEYGGWQPTAPGSDYDGDATGFFQLPSDGSLDAAPLEAPGHGYVPPMIMPLTPLAPAAGTDPAATGGWAAQQPQPADAQVEPSAPVQPEAVHWPEAGAQQHGDPQVTGQWTFPEEPGPDPAPAQGAAGHEMTGQWSIPIAEGDLPDESGEFLRSSPPVPETPWAAAAPPATLPGGAPAPWATLPGGAPAPWADQAPQEQAEPEPERAPAEQVDAADPVEPAEPADAAAPQPPAEPEPEPSQEPAQETAQEGAQEGTQEAAEEAAQPPEAGHDHQAPQDPATPAEAPQPSGEESPAAGPEPLPGADEHPPTSYVLRVNGTDRPVTDAWIGESLLYVLRERLGLAGAKDGCSQGECGACNVQVDGRLVASCLVPAATAAGSEVRTVEGLAGDGEPSDVQRALANCGAVQCGFCIPGMAMTVHDLLEGNHAPTELETRQALCGNLCRCSGYRGVLEAVREVVAERAASAAAAAEEAPAEPYEEVHREAQEEARIPHQAPPGAGRVQAHPHDGGMA